MTALLHFEPFMTGVKKILFVIRWKLPLFRSVELMKTKKIIKNRKKSYIISVLFAFKFAYRRIYSFIKNTKPTKCFHKFVLRIHIAFVPSYPIENNRGRIGEDGGQRWRWEAHYRRPIVGAPAKCPLYRGKSLPRPTEGHRRYI